MTRIQLHARVRLLHEQSGPSSYGDDQVRTFPAGAEGVVIDLLGGGAGLEIEFVIHPPEFGPDDEVVNYGLSHFLPLPVDQVELIS